MTLPLVEQFAYGLDAPICLTWELTYACNLSCVHCLSSSGRRDPRELTTAECMAVIDELEQMQVFYVNIGGGEPTVRTDFWDLVDYAAAHHVGVKFSTNGVKITPEIAHRLAASDCVDVQISLDGATAEVNDAVRGQGSYGAPAARVRPTTRAVAGAWRPSSSPGCRWTAPTPECVKGRGEHALTAVTAPPCPRPFGDHSHRSRPVPVSIGSTAGRSPDRACDESPLAGFRTGPPGTRGNPRIGCARCRHDEPAMPQAVACCGMADQGNHCSMSEGSDESGRYITGVTLPVDAGSTEK